MMETPVAADIADDEPVQPADVLYEILLRVPAKPLCRFRAVCPSWRSLLCDPTFIAAHAARHPGPLIVVAMEETYKDVKIMDISGNVVKRLKSAQQCPTDIMWTHRDLVCLLGDDGHHRVLDPATGVTSFLPPRPIRAATQTTMYVVGWSAAAGKYKALTVGVTGGKQVCLVVTLGGDHGWGWRERGSPPAMVELSRGGKVAVVRGVAYFLTMFPKAMVDGFHDWIVAFDLEAEAWWPASIRSPMVPQDESSQEFYVNLVEVNGHLVASINKPGRSTRVVELWFFMDPHKPLWTKRYTITLPTAIHVYESFGKPLQVLEDGKIVVWIWKYHPKYCGVPRVYDPKTETFTDGAATRVRHAVGGVYTGSLLRIVGALV
ncbi:hypothetical protein QYE76_003228 [Lolium multiflorum]|uniref:F-box domain-containing protein n=1 Tax=Lolium multiflorum TaxID=4521 RepID=A0AAD8RPR6_LOLMU|nr:hypothetical protein QYE76_003228 [Lolium multiflorum]